VKLDHLYEAREHVTDNETQIDPRIVQEAYQRVPKFFEEADAAMARPLQGAFREWFQANSPPLNTLASFKMVEQAFVAVVLQQLKSKDELLGLMKNGAPPGMDVKKQFVQYWQVFEDMTLTRCKILGWENAVKNRPDVPAKIWSATVVLRPVMKDVRDPVALSKMVAEETLKLFNEIKRLVPKK
jgi:hypothetical protein